MKAGKLELEQIQGLFGAGLGALREDVVAGPAVGVDCAVVSVGDDNCAVLKSDPITFATERIGWYAVHVNANDIATSGGDPCWFLSTVLLPLTASEDEARGVFAQIHEAAKSIGVAVVGGHTEVTPAVSQVTVAGTMVGFVKRKDLVLPQAIAPGDVLIITKGAAIEATSIIANEKAKEISEELGREVQEKAAAFLDVPGISALPEARIVREKGVHGMHDATEGGVRAAVYEMAQACGCGVLLDERAVPVHPITAKVCAVFSLDPLACIASGALLAALPKDRVDETLAALEAAGIKGAPIGEFLAKGAASERINLEGVREPLVYDPCDEITKLFDE